MSTSIDERIVEMQFNNKQFESGAQESLKTISKLNNALRFRNGTKGFQDIEAASNKVNFSGLESAIQDIQGKMSYLGTASRMVFSNMVSQAVQTGKQFVSALTVDPLKSGFSEYETQINSVQTVLANTESKGTTLKDVNEALDELNAYADKTIYNFTEMTRNIGTFTAAGVDLETSIASIKGISNLAAVSGSTSAQASNAMYQLSQAISSGTVKLMDWNSVVNAGMGGEVFQNALKRTARVHNIQIDEMIEKEGSFRETLSKGWLTADILTETLSTFTGDLSELDLKIMGYTDEETQEILKMGQTATDAATKVKTFTQLIDTLKESLQSGWTQSWEYIIGDFEESKNLWSSVSDVLSESIQKSADARNDFILTWKNLGGRTYAIQAISNTFKGLSNILSTIGSAFRSVFPKKTAEDFVLLSFNIRQLTKNFKDLFSERTLDPSVWEKTESGYKNLITGELQPLETALDKLRNIFTGVFSFFGILKSGLFEVFSLLSGNLDPVGDVFFYIIDVLSNFGKTISNVKNEIDNIGFVNWLDEVTKSFGPFKEQMASLFSTIVPENALSSLESLKTVAKDVGKTVSEFFFGKKYDTNEWTKTSTGYVNKTTNEFVAFEDTYSGLSKLINGFAPILSTIVEKLKPAIASFKTFFSSIISWGYSAFTSLTSSIKIEDWISWTTSFIETASSKVSGFISMIKSGIETIKSFFKVGDQTEASGFSASINSAMEKTSEIFGNVPSALEIFSTASNAIKKAIESISSNGVTIYQSIVNFFKPIVDKLPSFIDSFRAVFENSVATLERLLGKNPLKVILDFIVSFMGAKTLKSLSGTFNSLSDVFSKDIGGFFNSLSDYVNTYKKTLSFEKTSESFMRIALSIGVLVAALYVVSNIDYKKASYGLSIIASLAAVLAIINKVASVGGDKAGKNLLQISAALALMIIPLKILSGMKFETYVNGLLKIMGVLGVLAIFVKYTNGLGFGKNTSFAGLSFLLISITATLNLLNLMSFGSYIKSITYLSVVMGMLAIFMRSVKGFGFGKNTNFMGLSFLLLSLTATLNILNFMDPRSYLKSVTYLAVIMAGLIGFMQLTKDVPSGKSILGFAGLAGVLLTFALAMKMLADIELDRILGVSSSLSGIMLSFAALIKVISSMPITAAVKGALGISAIIVAIGAALSLVASMAGSVMVGLSEKMFAIGANLAAFSSLVEGINLQAIQNSATAFGILSEMIRSAPFTDSITFNTFGSVIVPLGSRLLSYSVLVSGLDLNKVSDSKIAADDIKYVVETLTGIKKGEYDLKSLGTDLVYIGSALELYSISSNKIGDASNTGNVDIGSAISDIVKELPSNEDLTKINEFTDSIGTGSKLIDFGVGLVSLGNAMSSFSNSTKTVDQTKVDNAMRSLTMLNDLQTKLPRDTSIFSVLLGKRQTLRSFGDDLTVLGNSLSLYATSVSGVNTTQIDNATASLELLSELQEKLPSVGGIASIFTGNKDISTFGTKLVTFGAGISAYYESVKLVEGQTLESLMKPIDFLVDIQSRLEETGGLSQLFTGTKDLSTLGSDLESFGDGVASFIGKFDNVTVSDSLKDVITSVVDPLVDMRVSIGNLDTSGTSLSDMDLKGLAKNINSFFEVLTIPDNVADISVFTGLLSNAITAFTDLISQSGTYGLEVGKSFADGIKTSYNFVFRSTSEVCNGGIAAIQSKYGSMYNSGSYLMSGLANGIYANAYAPINAMKSVSNRIVSTANRSWDINSPSKKFETIGMYGDLGLANGLLKYANVVESATNQVAGSAVKIANNAVSMISNAMNSETNFAPTIRPIMDLDDVSRGASSINGLITKTASVPVHSIRTEYSKRNLNEIQSYFGQNGKTSNDAVVTAINALNEKVDRLADNMSNLKVVTNTGALVAELKNPMNEALGRIAIKDKRRN